MIHTTHLQLAEYIDLQKMEEQLIVLDLRHNAYYALNETARFFIESLENGKDFEQIVLDANEEFDAPLETLRGDFEALLSELLAAGILIEDGHD